MRSHAAFVLLPTIANAACDGGKCNAPSTFTAMTIDPAGTGPTYVKSTGFSIDWATAIKSGVDAVRKYLGTASGNKFFLYGPNEADANYNDITTAWCKYTKPNSKPDAATGGRRRTGCGAKEKQAAKVFKTPAYMVSGGHVICICGDRSSGHYTTRIAPVLLRPDPSDSARTLWELSTREYTHAIQKAFGGPMPAWLMEGGAVYMQCMMGTIKPAAYGGAVAFSECFKTGGRRDPGILPNVRTLYGRTDATDWLTHYGADRACGTTEVPPYQKANPLPTEEAFRNGDYIFYDTGALAVAFAIYSSGKTSTDFWRGTSKTVAGAGFWHQVKPYGEMDYTEGWESDVPEGQGWRKALADFAGYDSVASFYAAFEKFVRPSSGKVVTEAAILAILESDSSVASQAASAASFVARGSLTSCSDAMKDFPALNSTSSNRPKSTTKPAAAGPSSTSSASMRATASVTAVVVVATAFM